MVPTPGVMALTLGLAGTMGLAVLTGCVRSSTPPQPASITSFVASPTTITDGQSATLTGVFSNGAGVITPGNLPAISGTAVTVTPTATTTYTLTVTPSSGSAVTSTAMVTVNPATVAPTVTVTPSASSITTAQALTVTAAVSGGTGNPTPTGTVTLTSGSYTSSVVTLSSGSGTINVPAGSLATGSDTLTVTYTPDSASSSTYKSATGTASVTVTAPPPTYGLTVNSSNPASGVTIHAAPADNGGITNGQTPYTLTYNAGTSVTLTAPATSAGNNFSSWTGCTTASTVTCNVTLNANTTVTANYAQTYVLTVNSTNPSSGVTIDYNNPLNNAIVPGVTSFTVTEPAGTTLNLTAPSTAGANIFTSWTGCTTASTVACSVTLNANTTVTANYAQTYVLTVNSTNPSSGVTIDYNNPLNNVIVPGVTSFTVTEPAGTTLNLTAPSTAGANGFTSWTGCTPSSTVTCSVTLNANVTVTANYAAATTVTVNLSSSGPAITDQLLGMNLAEWYDWADNASSLVSAFNTAGIKAIRWPGGSWSDDFHWGYQPGSTTLVPQYMCQTTSPVTGGWGGYSNFADFVSTIPLAGPYDLALTANYGTDEACTGGGDPNEAAAWANAAVADGIIPSHITVGNEEYGSWETDLHSSQHNGATYASTVVGSTGYYAEIKANSPNTLVGVDVEPNYAPWDQDVMSGAKGSYDFVEYHYYPETPGEESDTFIVQQAAQQLTTNIKNIKSELAEWGTPNTPIYVGEIGGPYSAPGKQSWSITQGLYAGQVLGEMMNDGVSRLTWWIGFGNCWGTEDNDSSSLYGWQDFGAYNVFSDGPSDTACPGDGPIGTLSPTARAFQLASSVAITGQHVLTATVAGDTTDVRAYAATNPAGTALMLFNDNETTSEPVLIALSGKSSTAGVTIITYDKAIYDLSGSPTGTPPDPSGTRTWAPPITTTMGAGSLPLALTLSPWSMNVVIIQ
ncbi:MAG: hypothetical protein ABSG51_03875 [Terracidiphilus sp.]